MAQESQEIEVRNLQFALDERVPKHWHGGSAGRTALFDSLSLVIPAGERFFVNSVKRYVPVLADRKLRRQAQLFCGQESVHQREHVKYNRMLASQGYRASAMEALIIGYLGLLAKIIPARWALATTCALEHFTAMFATHTLAHGTMLAGADPYVAAFWRWHAGEEIEHKSVPFDVYLAVGGHYLERVVVMIVTTVIFQAFTFTFFASLLWTDGRCFRLASWRDAYGLLATQRGMLRDYLAYYRRGFHPRQIDTAVAQARFRSELEGLRASTVVGHV